MAKVNIEVKGDKHLRMKEAPRCGMILLGPPNICREDQLWCKVKL
jgi:hypothetical protein